MAWSASGDINMQRLRRLSGGLISLVVVAVVIGLILNFGRNRICDGRVLVILHIPDEMGAQVAEIRYWGFGPVGSKPEDMRKVTSIAARVGKEYQCEIPFSYDEYGWVLKRRVETAPLPKEFTIWLYFTDGAWTQQTLAMPPENAQGVREATIRGTISTRAE
jgi:hypothetical protein